MLNKNKVFLLALIIFSFSTIFLTFSFFTKYKAANYEENFKKYKQLSNTVVPIKILEKVLKASIKANEEQKDIDFATIISLLAAKYYGNWEKFQNKDIETIFNKLDEGITKEEQAKFYENYQYFNDFYNAIFSEFVGRYEISTKNHDGSIIFEKKYGLKAYSPIAYNYPASFCDDFDNEINIAKQKGHFGNDIAAKKGTPFVAIESGIIEKAEKEDNIFKIELKSIDKKRTYIYSNCNQEKPFAQGIKKGTVVAAGQLLGFIGSNNCCKKGGAKILNCPYLHLAIKIKINQNIPEVYVDGYNILKFLEHHKSAFVKKGSDLVLKHIFKDDAFENCTKS